MVLSDIEFTYLWQRPARYTFEMPQLKEWVEHWCEGFALNLFAGKVKLNVNEFRVDLDKEMPADYYGDAFDFVSSWKGQKFDTIILDPPYNVRKSREKYGSRYIGSLTKIKNALYAIVSDKARIISLGYSTVGMSNMRGFKKAAICVVCHGGDHNDTLGLVELRNGQQYLSDRDDGSDSHTP